MQNILHFRAENITGYQTNLQKKNGVNAITLQKELQNFLNIFARQLLLKLTNKSNPMGEVPSGEFDKYR